ncbi:hypothetical protein [Streptomyces sp. NPDC049879]|uniref:hypothetical protein n=1 Tax=Streptomyces sp. NPDC049879 TaxID=3365598 RepID=UPI00379E3148
MPAQIDSQATAPVATYSKKLTAARRAVDRLRLEASGASKQDVAVWEAANRVQDLEAAARQTQVAAARQAARAMDVVLALVAVLTMAFSLGNIHQFALDNHVDDPIAYFLAPAIDLALIAALIGDAVLSRRGLDAGDWATRLRWYAAAATLVLNSWASWARLDVASIVLHTALPVLLFILAEAAVPYRQQFAESVRLAAAESVALPEIDQTPDSGPESVVRSADDLEESVYDQEAAPEPQTAPESITEPTGPRPRRATGRVPAAAKSAPRPTRSLDELISEASRLPAAEQTAEGIRLALRIGAKRAREVRDALSAPAEIPGQTVIDEAA